MLIYHTYIHTYMPRETDTVHVHLRFTRAEHKKLVKLKDAKGQTWEEFFLGMAGIAE